MQSKNSAQFVKAILSTYSPHVKDSVDHISPIFSNLQRGKYLGVVQNENT